MGKSRRSRGKAGQRADPIAKPVKPLTDPELVAIREKSILPVLKDLQSSDPKSRTAAAAAVANVVQDTKCRKLLLREQVVHILLSETLTDASLESRAAGWEILRVLTTEEEPDFCVHLYRIDVFTALQHACAKVTEALTSSATPFSKRPKAEQTFVWKIAKALSTVLPALAEAQDEALDQASNNQDVVRFLFTLTAHKATAPSVLESVLSSMITLSEDNQLFVEGILADSHTQCYKHLISYKAGFDSKAVLSCGVLHNIYRVMGWNDQNPGKDGACDAELIPVLSQTLERTEVPNNMVNGHDAFSPSETLQLALEILASIGTSLQESLEKGSQARGEAGAGLGDDQDTAMDAANDEDDELPDDEGKQADDDEEMNMDEIQADMDMIAGGDESAAQSSGIDDLPTLQALIQTAIPQAVRLSRADGSDEDSASLRTHALTTLNNVAWTISCIDFTEGSNASIQRYWTPVARMIWKDAVTPILASDTSDVGLATIVTSLAWALARTLHEEEFLVGDEHNKFISLYHASKNLGADQEDPFQSLGVKCIGVLGQLALDPAPIALNRELGVFLMTVVSQLPETPTADAVEALNQLFDIYGDEKKTCDKEVFWKDNFLEHMEAAVPKVRSMAKQVDKSKLPELRTRAEEVGLNLGRFIKYKQKHRV
ncbi:hypothetical protein F5Y15DRAFT_152639 [Xylariaceae sp. FL0016]|nr:hypothetical protein F5Y15DRAFT_152639 [Xylariaceae sp. FL0016]